MRSNRNHHHPSPQRTHPQKLTVALFGKRVQLKNAIGKMILNDNSVFVTKSASSVMEMNNSFKIINTPDFLDEECPHPDQMIIDFMAISHPGPDLFIMAIDSDNTQEENVVAQIRNLQHTFGKQITAHLVITLPDIESFHSLSHLKQRFNTRLAVANENLASECKNWCLARPSFQYDYRHYSEDIVKRRKTALEKRSHDGLPPSDHEGAGANSMGPPTLQHAFAAPAGAVVPEQHVGNSACAVPEDIFNIVLLGLAGTGKSASANNILAAVNSQLDPKELFKSQSSSMPVTTQCEFRIVTKAFWPQVRVVDTPDFFHDQVENSQAQVEECKKYCQQGQCVVLLVLQLGRFTDGERGILEKLENKLGWMIRESTIVLLTHGDDLKGSLESFINANHHLKSTVDLCGCRYHLFNNSAENPKQVMELFEKIPNSKDVFPVYKKKPPDCILF